MRQRRVKFEFRLTRPKSVPDNKRIGLEIRKLRRGAGLTLAQVSKACEVSLSYLCNLEMGRRNWTPARLDAVEEAIERMSEVNRGQ